MLNKQTSQQAETLFSGGSAQLIHHILHYKYSQELIHNYQQRIFEQFSKEKDLYEFVTPDQIQGIDFLQLYNSNQYLSQYNPLEATKFKIKNLILNRAHHDQIRPLHFYGTFFYFHIRYLKEQQHQKILQRFKKPQHTGKTTDEQILNSKPLTQRKKESETFSTPNQKQKEMNSLTGTKNKSQAGQEGSITILEQVNQQLSFIIKKVNQNKEHVNITDCLNKMKSSIQERKNRKDNKRKQTKQKNNEHCHLEEEEESYGLNKIKKYVKSTEKKKRKATSKGKIQANKKVLLTLTPKPKYQRIVYGQTHQQVSSHIKINMTHKRNKTKDKNKRNKSTKARKSVGKASSSSKSKLQIKK